MGKTRLGQVIFDSLKKRALHFFLVPVYFIAFAGNEFFEALIWKQVVTSLFVLLTFNVILMALLRKVVKNSMGILCVATVVEGFVFFYAHFQYFLVQALTIRAIYAMMISILILLVVLFLIKMANDVFVSSLNLYFNVLLLTFTIITSFAIAMKIKKEVSVFKKNEQPIVCSGELREEETLDNKPDIFFLLLDSYTSNESLDKYFDYDNSSFTKKLERDGFLVKSNLRSEYNNTLQSMTSLLNLSYLPAQSGVDEQKFSMDLTYGEWLFNNKVLNLLKGHNYRAKNLSVFNFNKSESKVKPLYFFQRLNGFYYSLFSKTIFGYLFTIYKRLTDYTRELEAVDKMRKEIEINEGFPRFVYFHSLACHTPFYFKSNGDIKPWTQFLSNGNDSDYISAITHTNRIVEGFVDQILKNNPESVIIILSDHGSRKLNQTFEMEKTIEELSVFGAVYLPDKSYGSFEHVFNSKDMFKHSLEKALNCKLIVPVLGH
jgi:hypothetical protein